MITGIKCYSNVKIEKETFQGGFSPIEGLPIVTISVITYNSSQFILETLNSIKNQTYPNLILQISDDCSVDDTVSICRNWISENNDRFVKCKIFIPEHNTGVSANLNRAWDNCETAYCKDIAGDDILLPDCIENNMTYLEEHSDVVILFSKAKTFRVIYGRKCDLGYKHDYSFFEKSLEDQYKTLIEVGNVLPASSTFINIEKIRDLGIFNDERLPLLEDYPRWLQMLRKGVHFSFLDMDTVLYRLDLDSLSVGLFSPNFYKNNVLFYLYYFIDEINNGKDRDEIYEIIANHETRFYKNCYDLARNRRIIRFMDDIIRPIQNIQRLAKSFVSKSIIKL